MAHLGVGRHSVQLLSRLLDPVAIVRVDDVDETLGPCVIMAPQRPNAVLPANVPNTEFEILEAAGLDVEVNRGHSTNCIGSPLWPVLQLVQDGGLASSVEACHEKPYIPPAEDAERVAHAARRGCER
eukprot:scaffold201416_cov33-Tisochrysis_lutea.AAC.2